MVYAALSTEEGRGRAAPPTGPRPTRLSAAYSLGQTPLELESLAAAVGQAVQRGERPDGGQMAVAAVGRQHS